MQKGLKILFYTAVFSLLFSLMWLLGCAEVAPDQWTSVTTTYVKSFALVDLFFVVFLELVYRRFAPPESPSRNIL